MADSDHADDKTKAGQARPDGDGISRLTRPSCALFVLPVFLPVLFLLERFGIDISGWLGEVLEQLESIQPHFIVIAVALKGSESALTSLAWTHVLRAAYPERQIPYRLVLAGYQGGAALNVVAPAKAGTLANFGILKLNIRGSRIPTLVSTFAVNSIAFTVFGIANMLVVLVLFHQAIAEELAAAWQPGAGLLAGHPVLIPIILAGLAVAGVLLYRALRPGIGEMKEQIAAGGAILRTPRRYAVSVFLPALGAYACRCGYSAVFMAAFDIPVTFQTVFLLLGASLVSSVIGVTPGGVGINQAVAVAVLSAYAPAEVITAASISRDVIFKAWHMLFGLILVAWVFGWRGTKSLIEHRDDLAHEGAAGNEINSRAAVALTGDASPRVSDRRC